MSRQIPDGSFEISFKHKLEYWGNGLGYIKKWLKKCQFDILLIIIYLSVVRVTEMHVLDTIIVQLRDRVILENAQKLLD
jgi:hypothetical protein